METTTVNYFPWTTSMMAFVIDKDNRVLLTAENELWGTYKMDSTGEVNIRKMVCDELYKYDILTSPEDLQHIGILNNEGRTVFIYIVNEFVTNSPTPSLNSLWYFKEEIPFHRLAGFEKHILSMILNGKKIGF